VQQHALACRRGRSGRPGAGALQGGGPLLAMAQILGGAGVAPARIRIHQALLSHAGR
jgi:hypothetical protein